MSDNENINNLSEGFQEEENDCIIMDNIDNQDGVQGIHNGNIQDQIDLQNQGENLEAFDQNQIEEENHGQFVAVYSQNILQDNQQQFIHQNQDNQGNIFLNNQLQPQQTVFQQQQFLNQQQIQPSQEILLQQQSQIIGQGQQQFFQQNQINNNNITNDQQNVIQLQENQKNNTSFRSPLPQPINNQYYQYSNSLDKALPPKDNEPYMKLTVLKTSAQQSESQYHMVTHKGMIGSKKNTINEDIVIGRQQATQNESQMEIHPNDIVLPANDRAISRIHCKIIYKDGFRIQKKVPINFFTFLQVQHPRSQSVWSSLPIHLFNHIWKFIKPKYQFYIADIGSVYGTYIRVKPNLSQIVEKGQVYLIGADTLFNVVGICNGQSKLNQNQNKMQQYNQTTSLRNNFTNSADKMNYNYEQIINCDDQQQKEEQIFSQKQKQMEEEKIDQDQFQTVKKQSSELNMSFLQFLANQKQQAYEIHGLDEQELDQLNKLLKQQDENQNQTTISGNQSQDFSRPYVQIEIPNSGTIHPKHLFVGSNSDQEIKVFRMGRSQECDIIINQNTISRKQSQIYYNPITSSWELRDGNDNKESANGTWISLSDYREKKDQNRQESEQREIYDGTEIKISESIIKIEIINNDIQTVKNRENNQKQLQ